MSVSEKLSLMEALWDDLCRSESDVPVAEWHKEILEQRQQQIAEGSAKFIPWDEVKEKIAKRIS